MPTYPVKEKCFFNGKVHRPGQTVTIDEPFPVGKKPAWAGEAIRETATQVKSRKAAASKATKAKADAKKADTKEINEVSFNEAPQSNTETL